MPKPKRYRTARSFNREVITKAKCVRAFRAAVKRFVRAEIELDNAGAAYDRLRDLSFTMGWKMPKTILSNPLAQKR